MIGALILLYKKAFFFLQFEREGRGKHTHTVLKTVSSISNLPDETRFEFIIPNLEQRNLATAQPDTKSCPV